MDNNTVPVVVGLRLGSPLCHAHTCHHCGVHIDGTATHGLSYKWSEAHRQHHAAVNDIIHCTMSAAHLPSRLEPTGLSCSNGKRPNGVSLVPWRSGRLLVWDATCPDICHSHLPSVTPPESQGQWQPWLSGASRRSTQPPTNAVSLRMYVLCKVILGHVKTFVDSQTTMNTPPGGIYVSLPCLE